MVICNEEFVEHRLVDGDVYGAGVSAVHLCVCNAPLLYFNSLPILRVYTIKDFQPFQQQAS